MTRANISSELLKQFRIRANLSQQALANVSGVSKKTIARVEAGKSSANTSTVTRLANALDVQPKDLSGQSDLVEKDELRRKMRRAGYRLLKAMISENTEVAFQMVEKTYGISSADQISLAPLLAALLAEGSLAWRKQKLEEVDQAIEILEGADYGHRMFVTGGARAEEGYCSEHESIGQRDVFGKTTMNDAEDYGPDLTDPFTEYLRHLVKQYGADHVNVFRENMTEEYDPYDPWITTVLCSDWSRLGYSINSAELGHLAGDDDWARHALRRGHVKIADIPEHLLGDDVSEERSAWLGSKVPHAEIKEVEAEIAEFAALLGSEPANEEESRK